MRILLDESLPKDLAPLIAGHEVTTVRAAGWSGVKNGKLLALAADRFDVLLTADRNLEHQQNLSALPVSVVVLFVRRTRVQAIEPLVPELLKLLNHLPPRVLRKIGN
jgi:predicted nuclease of predicted toxin-antitoxin system